MKKIIPPNSRVIFYIIIFIAVSYAMINFFDKPDISIVKVDFPNETIAGKDFTVSATIINSGSKDINEEFHVAFYSVQNDMDHLKAEGFIWKEAVINGLAAGKTATIEKTFHPFEDWTGKFPPGLYELGIFVDKHCWGWSASDCSSSISERNEQNNWLGKKFEFTSQ